MSQQLVQRMSAPLRQQVTELLRKSIVALEFEPGERLHERTLCERYGVSRTVIREALRHLEAQGLVTTVPQRGPVVAELDPADAEGMFEVRAVLEALAGKLFAERATDAERRALQQNFERVRVAYAGKPLAEQLAAKDDFYGAMLTGAHNATIFHTLRSLHNRIQMFRSLSLQAAGRLQESVAELELIVDALAVQPDPQRAWDACEQHVRSAGAVALGQLRRAPDAKGTT